MSRSEAYLQRTMRLTTFITGSQWLYVPGVPSSATERWLQCNQENRSFHDCSERAYDAAAIARVTVLVLGVLMLGAGLFIVSQPVDGDDFETATGVAWDEFRSSDPEAADYLEREARLLGVAFAVLGGVAAALAVTFLKTGSRTAWTIAWFIPIAFAGTAAVFYSADASVLGGFYVGATVFVVAVVLTGRSRAWA